MSGRRDSRSGRRRKSAAERAANYTRIKTIGKGSYGTVDLVKRKDNHKLYVMKRVKYAANDGEHKGALQEVKFLRMLKHPNVVDFGEAFVTPDRAFLCIVMGYCEGGDLIHMIKEHRKADRYIPEDTVMEWFVQMCMALAYLHDQRILHRDIKPHNVFLTNHGRVVKVGDFGVTRILDHTRSMAKTTIGTPYYVSPEICCNRPYNAKSDVWALGVVLYELCQLRVPFDAANFPQLRVKIVHNQPAPLNGPYSKELQQLVTDMLTKDQRARPDVRSLLKRRLCQHHLRLLMQRHSKKPAPKRQPEPAPSEAGPGTSGAGASAAGAPMSASFMKNQRKQSKLEAKLAAKQRALERAKGEDQTTPRRVDVGGARLSHKQREDFIGGSEAKHPEEAEKLAKEVADVEEELVQTSVNVHTLVVANEQKQDEEAVHNNAATILAQAAEESSADEGKHVELNPGGGDDEEKSNSSTLGSVGHEMVHQISCGNIHIDPARVTAGAKLRDIDSPVVQAGRGLDGSSESKHGRGDSHTSPLPRGTEREDGRAATGRDVERASGHSRGSSMGRDPRGHRRTSSRSGSRHGSSRGSHVSGAGAGRGATPRAGYREGVVVVPRLELGAGGGGPRPVPTQRTARSAGAVSARAVDAYGRPVSSQRTNSRGSSRGGTRPASKGRSRRSSDARDSARSSARDSAYGESRASRMSRADSRALLAHPMGIDPHSLQLNEANQQQALLINRLPDVRPESRGRPLTAGSDFSEQLDQDVLASVRVVEQGLSARRNVAPGVGLAPSSSRVNLRRRVETSVHLQPLRR